MTASYYSGTIADYMVTLAGCLEAAGVPATPYPDGSGINWGTDIEANREPEQATFAACQNAVGRPPSPPPLTDDYVHALFSYYLVNADCLRGLGYSIPPAPSEETWTDHYRAAMAGTAEPDFWAPYFLLPDGMTQEETDRAEALCPQFMPEQ